MPWARMAVRLARRVRHCGEPFQDLQQVAGLGLFKAVSRFDPSLGIASPREIAAHAGLTEAEVRLGQEALELYGAVARSPASA